MPLRVVVVDSHRVSRSAPIIRGLAADVEIVGTVVPTVSRPFDLWNKATHFHPSRDTWRARAFFNGARFDAMSRSVQEKVRALPPFDVVLLVYPVLCRPPQGPPYVVLTDNTMAVTQRQFRRWASLTHRETERSMARERDVFSGAAFVATTGSQARNSAISDYGCGPGRVVNVGFSLTVPFPPPRIGRQPARRVLFVATSFWRKGGATLLDAWSRVVAAVPDARLDVVGPNHRPPRNLAGSVRWRGPLSGDELAQAYRSADVFVLPTLFESSVPNAIREAMAHGLPVVASDVPGIAIDAPPETTLAPPGDPVALAERLVELLRDPDLAASRGAALREWAATSFDPRRLADSLRPLLEQAAASGGRARG